MMNKKNDKAELRQRFGFRKLASGMLVSGIIGAFFLVGGQSVQADTTNTSSAEPTSAVVETATDQEQNNKADSKQTETIAKDEVQAESANTNVEKETAEVNTVKTTEDIQAPKEVKQDAVTDANKKVEPVNTQDNQSQINFDDWGYSTNDDGVTINGYKGTDVADVIVPNTYDFLNAGIITGDQKAYIDRMTLRSIARTSGVKSITISHNGDGQLYVTDPKGLGLAAAFQTTYMTPTVETIDVSNLNTTGVVNFSNIFQGETNLKEIIGLDKWDLSSATNLGGLFQDCNNLSPDTFKQISKWNVSNVTNLAYTFAGTLINDLNLIKDWDVSNVTNLNATFYYLPELTTLDGLQNWDVSKVTNLQATFEEEPKLNDISAIKNWNTSNVTNFYSTFTYDSNLTDISPLANWDTSRGQTFLYMFLYCAGLENVDALNNWDVSNATNMAGMFQGAGVKGLVNLSNWSLHTGTNTDSMFAGGTYRNPSNPSQIITINTPLMVIVKDQASADMINNGQNTFADRYLTKFIVGEGETLNGDASHPAMAFTSTDAAKPDFEKWLKETTASKPGYTFKGWRGVAGTEYGNSGLFGQYEPIFESDTPDVPVNPDTPVNPENPDTPAPVHPTNPSDDKEADNKDNNVVPHPVRPNGNHSNKNHITNVATVKRVNNDSSLTKDSVKVVNTSNTNAEKLPQTGTRDTNVWAALGLGLVSVLGLFGLITRKKRD